MEIKKVMIIGMGALGLMYGDHIQERCGADAVTFLMDETRLVRHSRDVYTINGVKKQFRMQSNLAEPADLLMVATKYGSLQDAIQLAENANAVDEHTVIISMLNGIISEDILAEHFSRKNILYSVALGMDAMRDGTSLAYTHKGRVQFGMVEESQREAMESLQEFFQRIGLPHEVVADIRKAMWTKFMMNVGANQTCMVYETTYYGALHTYKDKMHGAMREVMAIGKAEGISLTEEDFIFCIETLSGLNPEGYPSMRQDAVAGRKSEVELFAGTVLKLAARHGVETPINQYYYDRIHQIEAAY